MIIYKIECNGEFYIGSSKKLSTRINQHRYCCNKEGNPKYYLPIYKYIREHGGFDNVIISIINNVDITDLIEQKKEEQKIIDDLNPLLNTHRAYQEITDKKLYDSLRYYRKKNIICPCCNKLKDKYNYSVHQQTKKYKNYIETLSP